MSTLHRKSVRVFLLLGTAIGSLSAQELPLYVNQGVNLSFEQQLFYTYEKHDLDFDTRGRVESRHNAAGASLAYNVADTIQIALHGGVLIDPTVRNSVSTWRGNSGYFYGLDVADHVFPQTGVWPGVVVQAGIGSQTSFFNRQETAGSQALIDQKMRDLRYGGSAVATWKWKHLTPYFGPRVEGSDVKWSDNQAAGSLSEIHGHLDKHVGIVMGCTLTLTQGLDIQLEGRALGETSLRASVQWLKF